jgi:hypothetical protein
MKLTIFPRLSDSESHTPVSVGRAKGRRQCGQNRQRYQLLSVPSAPAAPSASPGLSAIGVTAPSNNGQSDHYPGDGAGETTTRASGRTDTAGQALGAAPPLTAYRAMTICEG